MKTKTKINILLPILLIIETLVCIGSAYAIVIAFIPPESAWGTAVIPLAFIALGATLFIGIYLTKRLLRLPSWRAAWIAFTT